MLPRSSSRKVKRVEISCSYPGLYQRLAFRCDSSKEVVSRDSIMEVTQISYGVHRAARHINAQDRFPCSKKRMDVDAIGGEPRRRA